MSDDQADRVPASLVDLLFGDAVAGAVGAADDQADESALLVHAAGVDHSLGEVRRRATDIAGALADAGVAAGAPVGVMLPDPEVVAALFGVWRAGGVYVPLNPRLARGDLAHVLTSVEPAVVVTVDEHVDRFGDRPLVVVGADRIVHRPGTVGERRFDSEVALVQFTSGTTGRPKPVLLTHDGVRQLLENVITTLRTRPTGGPAKPPMPNLIPVSLSLWAGIYQVLFARLVGAPVVVMDGFDPHEFADLVARFGIRSTVLPPAAMTMLSDATDITSLAPLKYVRSITAPLSPLQARRFRDRFGLAVLNGYGQTEIGGEIIGWSGADAREHGDDKLGAVGRPHPGVEVRSEAGTGELQVRTPSMSAGYADGADLSDRLTADGWFRTGDVGVVDGDGFVWIDGRLGDMINRGGLKVFPGEVEEVLRLAPDVADVAVAGVPDERLGEVPVAFVVAAAGAAPDPAALAALCREHLAPYKVPVRFEAVPALPRNEVGKVLVRELTAGRPTADRQL
ncbi:MAG TPA: class I adenylate-forming enzyme family protein [Acidimicrobiales bacterium]|nr:class I adenylate-forming enzyme family protein [Acidimicrobiales bacterium]